jgi:TRAP-type C4-dicarboxylate transport system permease small subunit
MNHRSAPRPAPSLLLRAVEAVLAILMLAMVVMVFGNVVLRYAFNSNIVVSEELSRYFFVWLTFIGAVVAVHEGTHLGVDNLVTRLSRSGKIVCLAICEILIVVCCAMIFWGTWRQHDVNATSFAPVTGMSMIWVFGVAYVTSALIGLHAARKLWRIATGRIGDAELVEVGGDGGEPDSGLPAPRPGPR